MSIIIPETAEAPALNTPVWICSGPGVFQFGFLDNIRFVTSL